MYERNRKDIVFPIKTFRPLTDYYFSKDMIGMKIIYEVAIKQVNCNVYVLVCD